MTVRYVFYISDVEAWGKKNGDMIEYENNKTSSAMILISKKGGRVRLEKVYPDQCHVTLPNLWSKLPDKYIEEKALSVTVKEEVCSEEGRRRGLYSEKPWIVLDGRDNKALSFDANGTFDDIPKMKKILNGVRRGIISPIKDYDAPQKGKILREVHDVSIEKIIVEISLDDSSPYQIIAKTLKRHYKEEWNLENLKAVASGEVTVRNFGPKSKVLLSMMLKEIELVLATSN